MSLASRIARKCISNARHAQLSTNTKFSYSIVIPEATYSPWNDDKEFVSTFDSIRQNTLVDIYRAHELWDLVQETISYGGDILEVGVWRGGTGCLMAKRAKQLNPSATVFLCDTFSGVVKASERDSHYHGGEHADTSVDIVRQLATKMGLDNIQLLKGIFPDATGDKIEDMRFSLCHIDVDVYESAKQVTEWVWPRLVTGGVIVYDDYGFLGCEGVTNLVNERRQHGGAVTLHNLNGHAIVVKVR
jgi:O-methyltransferase